ncbi:MAG: phosphatase PAP2 family protein [Candidatus Contendobacter sp.]|nr:phosphatase PAP2 family protein [Candidatus Contendobacter sp.]MDG4557225.1 phosphatase PAP2 family protein [Candidatus Contendobacter sp.]
MSWDNQILLFTAAHRSEVLDYGFGTVTWLGSLYVLAPLATLFVTVLLYFQKRWEALLLVVGFGGAALLAHLAKALLARPRPDLVDPVIALPADGSFPSAHTAQIVAFALCAVLVVRRTLPEWQYAAGVVAVLLIAVVATSRVYLQVHYPSDVLGGIALGIGWIVLARKIL